MECAQLHLYMYLYVQFSQGKESPLFFVWVFTMQWLWCNCEYTLGYKGGYESHYIAWQEVVNKGAGLAMLGENPSSHSCLNFSGGSAVCVAASSIHREQETNLQKQV